MSVDLAAYRRFLEAKAVASPRLGLDVADCDVNPILKDHQRAMVRWGVAGGRRAWFAAFGLGKSVVQIEALRLIAERRGGRGLIVAPLGVRQEFMRDAAMLGVPLRFVRRPAEAEATGLHITNYETVRDGKLDPAAFCCASLDEASVLRGMGGTKTFREFMRLFDPVPHRFVATATPSPNDFIELLSYAAFLGVMDIGQAKTRFFQRDSEKADALTLRPHKAREFWLWLAGWGLMVQKPSDLGFSDDGYALPPLRVEYHCVPAELTGRTTERDGQGILIRSAAIGVTQAAREKRDTLPARIAKMRELVDRHADENVLLWHDLEAERHAIEKAVPGVVSVYGSQDLEAREATIAGFSEGRIRRLAAKPVIAGSGCNFQRHCATAIFVGVDFKFNDFVQAIHRIQRFLQPREVTIHVVYAETQQDVLRTLQRKWRQHEELVATMTEIIREYGLAEAAMAEVLGRSIGVERIEVTGEGYRLVNADSVEECARLDEASVGLIVTSIPFSTQYEYTPSYNDFGHTDDDGHFWAQMDFLTPSLVRALMPGRVAAIHVKDRIVPGGITGFGFQTLSTFHCDAIAHFRRHGLAYLGMKTIVTDVVRENNQTYRLGWSEQLKDGSRMGCGVPEYLLLFRKPPSDRSDGYADTRVEKARKEWSAEARAWRGEGGYPLARWQLDAHGFARSSGDRALAPEDLSGLDPDQVFKVWRAYSLASIYDFEHHVRIGEHLTTLGRLPPTFMLIPPHSWHPDVWSDVARMLTLNGAQAAKGREMHLCPLQFDIVDRAIVQYSMPGETVLDPFGGLMTVPARALRLGRRAIGVELNTGYFLDGCKHVEAEARAKAMPSLFDYAGLRPLPDAPAEAAGAAPFLPPPAGPAAEAAE